MLHSRSLQAHRRGHTVRRVLQRLVASLVAAACISSALLVTACSEPPETPSSEVLATAVAATPTAEREYGTATPAPGPQTPPAPTNPSPPAAVSPQAPPAPLPGVPSLPSEAAPGDLDASPAGPTEAPTPVPPTVVAEENTAFANRVVDLINAARQQENLEPLAAVPSLAEAAQGQARAMAEAGLLSHTGPDGSTVVGRVQAAGYSGWTALGEVCTAGQESPEEAVTHWLASAEHRARLLDPAYRELGTGYYYLSTTAYGHWWAVDLGAR